jgi:hypothetical protein
MGTVFSQSDLQSWLVRIYSSNYLAAMVTERYPIIPCVQDYKAIIAEAAEAHFYGLDHIAVSGLLPVIEGAGKKLAQGVGVKFSSPTAFSDLATSFARLMVNGNDMTLGTFGERPKYLIIEKEAETRDNCERCTDSSKVLLDPKKSSHRFPVGASPQPPRSCSRSAQTR